MLKNILFTLILITFTLSVNAQNPKPQPANKIVKAAMHDAKAGKKNVMLIFHASWCKWCTRLEKAIASPELSGIFKNNWIVTYLDVMERGGKIDSLENPGGKEIMKKYGGENAGLPFCAFIDKSGKLIGNSNIMPDKTNIGYPGSKEEIALFVDLLKRTSKKLSEDHKAAIIDYLVKNAPKQH
jgi:thioredoxin-related protein